MITCIAKTAAGKQCTAAPLKDSEFCIFHSPLPEHQELARSGRLLGGLRRRQMPKSEGYPDSVRDSESLLAYIDSALQDAKMVEGSIQRLHVMASLLRVAVDIVSLVEIGAQMDVLKSLYFKENSNATTKNRL